MTSDVLVSHFMYCETSVETLVKVKPKLPYERKQTLISQN